MVKGGGPWSLLLVLSLPFPALSGPHFIPPGLSPVQPADSTESTTTSSSTTTGGGGVFSATMTVEAEANSTASPTQPLKIEIDMEEVSGNVTGGATKPVWHPYLIKVTSGTGDAGTTSPPPLLAEEVTVVEMSPSTDETTTTTTTTPVTTPTAAPPLITEELTTASPETPSTTTPPPPDQQQQFVPNKTELGEAKDQSAPKKKKKKPPQPEAEGEPETPKPTARAPEGSSLTLPPAGETLATEPPQVYLVIQESQPDPQKQTELPVALQIISTEDLDLRSEVPGPEAPVSSTKDTGTNVSNTASELGNTIVSINDKGISVEETIDKPSAAEPHFREVYFDQVVDHFSFTSRQKTYRQRYLITDEFWGKSFGPIFLYTGNEGDVWDFANNSRFLIELASEQKAMVIFAEHRYYGKSLPFGKKSYDKSNIEFLTVEQALADYVVLVTKLKTDLDAENCPVITFGGSYGGMLSAYMRIKYPNIVVGALASSAPVVSTANIGDGRQFFHDVTKDFDRNSPDCVSKIREAFHELESLAQQQAWSKITSKLSLCKPIKSRKEVDHLYGWARNAFTYLAMFDYPYKTEVALHFPANPVDVACRYIKTKSDHIDGLLDILGMFYNSTGTQKCFDIYTEYIHCADPTGCGLGAASLAWDFQACTEINLLYESTNETDMFPAIPFTEAMRKNYCHSKWGVYPNSEWLKIQYWGDDFKAASNIIFSNGDLDPWANGGILKDVNPSVVAFIIEGGAHHLDLRASNPADPPSVTAIRKKESSIISEWVKKHQGHSV